MLFELACVPRVFLETKAHSHQGKRIWFGNDFVPIMHDSIVSCLWFLLQVSRIFPSSLTQIVKY
jgi:hypothetical protein